MSLTLTWQDFNPLGFLLEDRELELKRAACEDAQPPSPKRQRPSLCIDISPFADYNEPYTLFKDEPLLSIPEGVDEDAVTPRIMPAASTMCIDLA